MKLEEIVENWKEEIFPMLSSGNALFIACFAANGDILYANNAMNFLFEKGPEDCFINPTFENILSPNLSGNFFDGVITFGNIHSIDNFSIVGKFFRKENKILLLGELDIQELIEKNLIFRELNSENSNLNRLLIKEKNALKQNQNELKATQQKLMELVATKDKFFSIIAHDLRSPFSGFLGLSELLAFEYEKLDKDEIIQIATSMNNAAKRLYEFLENLLEWSRSQMGKIEYNPSQIDIKSLFERNIQLMTETAAKKEISMEIGNSPRLLVKADNYMLNTIMRNLVSNAVKFTPSGGKVILQADIADANTISISVSDTGVGMNENVKSKIFNIESKYSSPGTGGESGTGLGLILCKELVKLNFGSVSVESEEGKGSIFTVKLPLWID